MYKSVGCASFKGSCHYMRAIVLFAFLMVISSSCAGYANTDYREDISLTEAQGRVPFTICLPTGLPAGTDPTPRIQYHADFGARDEAELRLRYYRQDSQELIFEVYQAYRPILSERDIHERREEWILALSRWAKNETKVETAQDQLQTRVTTYREQEIERGLFEITEPVGLRATMVVWFQNGVIYHVYTRLPASEAKQVAGSIACTSMPVMTPPP